MTKVGLFIDISNLYHSCNRKYGRKIDYARFIEFCNDFGSLICIRAYGCQKGDEAKSFINHLRNLGIEVKFKKVKEFHNGLSKGDWDVGMTIDIIESIDDFDTIILATADSDFAPLVQYLKNRGKHVIVIGSNIGRDLYFMTNCLEIPPSLVEGEILR
jgi:uncharacterized protein (TIGR00288 family)